MKTLIVPHSKTFNSNYLRSIPTRNKDISNLSPITPHQALFVLTHNAHPASTKAAGGVA